MMSSHCLHGAKGKAHLCQPPQEGGKLTSQRKRIGKLAQGETPAPKGLAMCFSVWFVLGQGMRLTRNREAEAAGAG